MFSLIKKLKLLVRKIGSYDRRLIDIQTMLGRIELRQNQERMSPVFKENEFKVFSQWGEDGLIQFLLRYVNIDNSVFVEFGVENYLESNTRFLLINNNWSGLVIDGSPDNMAYIKSDPIYWRHNLKAHCAFVTKENINDLLKENGVVGDIGILSIDLDGNDYWIWDAIDVVSPAIVIIEYNARFGTYMSVTVPYDRNFVRSQKHHSMIYFGASIKALCSLAEEKGYAFVGCGSAGVNAFFVRRDLMVKEIKELTVEEGYVRNKFRESRNQDGQLIYLSQEDEYKLITSLPLDTV
ncbi:hypothetical protein OAE14_00210 [Alphaproteobacteria bacterium]|nr:hypothetical protein [Alphaproteobacteria bacterium]